MPMLSTCLLNSLTDREVIAEALNKGYNFALYRMPGSEYAQLCVSQHLEYEYLADNAGSPTGNGFVIAPFANDRQLFIPAEYSRTINLFSYAKETDKSSQSKSVKPFYNTQSMPEDYAKSVNGIIQRLKLDGGKTVFSTIHQGVCTLPLFDMLVQLSYSYPKAFVFCFKLKDEQRIWLGATPELLVNFTKQELHTMALAGTRAVSNGEQPWDTKNKKEQAMVKDFIVDKMKAFGLSPELSEPYTRQAGNIEHICTEISAALPYRFDLKSFLKELSPTPAVSGLPRDKAMQDIARYEHHSRAFYAGYCGPVTADATSLFVTLRCMSFDPTTHECTLYAGGGITAESDPATEWHEVKSKAATLSGPLGISLDIP